MNREWALPVYTILIQLATGGYLILWIIRARQYSSYSSQDEDQVTRVPVLILFLTVVTAIVGAHFHLSKPFISILAVRNFARSWLSREIVSTIAFFLLSGGLTILVWFVKGKQNLKSGLGWATTLSGLATVYCMSRVYMLPTQVLWNAEATTLSYFGEALLLGTVAIFAILLMDLNFYYEKYPEKAKTHEQVLTKALPWLSAVASFALIVTLVIEVAQLLSLWTEYDKTAETSMQLLFDLYRPLVVTRLTLSIFGVGWLLFTLWRTLRKNEAIRLLITPSYIAILIVLVGEILGRFLFFAIHVRTGI